MKLDEIEKLAKEIGDKSYKNGSTEWHCFVHGYKAGLERSMFLNGNTVKRVANCRHPSWAQSFNGAKNKRHCSICGKYFH